MQYSCFFVPNEKNRKICKKGVDELKTAWYYMKALTERGTLSKMSKNKLKKMLDKQESA